MKLAGAAGLSLSLAAILFAWPGFGYDEARRPAVLLGAALVLAAGAGQSGRASWIPRLADLALLALAVSSLVAVNRTEAAAALFPAVVAWIFLRGAASGWISRPFLERWGLVLISATGVLFSGYGLCQHLGADFLGIGQKQLAVSTVGNTNYAGVLSAVFAVSGVTLALFESRLRWRAVGAAAALLGALHLSASGSLAGLCGLGVGVAVVFAINIRRAGARPVALLPILVLAAAVLPSVVRVGERGAAVAQGGDRTSQIRLGLWKGTVRLAAAHPFLGCGTGNFRMAFPPYRDDAERKMTHEGRGLSYVEAEDPHSTYLKVWAESGPIALLALLAAGILAVASGIRGSSLAVAGSAGLVALAVSGAFNSLSGHLPFAVLAGLFAGFTVPSAPDAPPRPVALRAGIYVAAAFLAFAPLPWFIADGRFRDAMHTSDPAERLAHAREAVSALPGHWRARFQIAVCWRVLGESEGTVRAELRDILEIHPHHVPALVALAEGASPEEEERLLRRAEELAPEFAAVQQRLLMLDLKRGDYPAVRRRLARILESLPGDADVLYAMGRTWLQEGKRDEALPWMRRAAAANPKYREKLATDHPELKGDPRFTELLGP